MIEKQNGLVFTVNLTLVGTVTFDSDSNSGLLILALRFVEFFDYFYILFAHIKNQTISLA